jgi:uncharacterized protein YvpB
VMASENWAKPERRFQTVEVRMIVSDIGIDEIFYGCEIVDVMMTFKYYGGRRWAVMIK